MNSETKISNQSCIAEISLGQKNPLPNLGFRLQPKLDSRGQVDFISPKILSASWMSFFKNPTAKFSSILKCLGHEKTKESEISDELFVCIYFVSINV